MKNNKYLFAVLAVTASLSMNADLINVQVCKNIQKNSERLICYDTLFKNADSDAVNQTIAKTAPKHPSQAILLDRKEQIEEFGAEQIKPVSPDHIEAKILGEFKGWSGKTVFKLDNGQIWKQINNGVKDYKIGTPMLQPKVSISKGMFGSYNFRVEGVKRMIQVKRVK